MIHQHAGEVSLSSLRGSVIGGQYCYLNSQEEQTVFSMLLLP